MSPRSRKSKAAKRTSAQSRVTVDRGDDKSGNFLDKIQTDLEKNQSYLNLILGALIVIVLGVLVFNYFNKPSDTGDLGPSQQVVDEQGDITKEGLPGKYTVKEGDTLFLIAQKYYDDGNLYTEIMRENSLVGDAIETGQELNIPKLASAEPLASPSPEASATPEPSTEPEASVAPAPAGEKGATMTDQSWGEKISGETYTVVKGDWLSKIAGRAYGDIMLYQKIAQANNISNPNSIEVGTVLKIPRD